MFHTSLLVLGWARDVEACDDLHTRTSVVGVASDGTWLELEYARHDEAHGQDESPLAGWDRR